MSELPPHVDETVQKVSRLHEEHRARASAAQRLSERLTRLFSQPRFLGFISLALAAWLILGLVLQANRIRFDPWPFQGLQTVTAVLALYMGAFILATQRRDDELAALRDKLTLELAILSEQKIAKAIQLLEELRRDLPQARDRRDPEAEVFAKPADPDVVAEALREPDSPDDSQAPP